MPIQIRVDFRANKQNRDLLSETIFEVQKKNNLKSFFCSVPDYGYAFITPSQCKNEHEDENDFLVGDADFVFRAMAVLSSKPNGLMFLESITKK